MTLTVRGIALNGDGRRNTRRATGSTAGCLLWTGLASPLVYACEVVNAWEHDAARRNLDRRTTVLGLRPELDGAAAHATTARRSPTLVRRSRRPCHRMTRGIARGRPRTTTATVTTRPPPTKPTTRVSAALALRITGASWSSGANGRTALDTRLRPRTTWGGLLVGTVWHRATGRQTLWIPVMECGPLGV